MTRLFYPKPAMKKRQLPLHLTAFIILLAFAAYWWHRPNKKPTPTDPFATTAASHKTIRKQIEAVGQLKIKGSMRVGSLITGIIEQVHITENSPVHKGDPLVTLATVGQDRALKAAQAHFARATAALEYQQRHVARLTSLAAHNHTTQDSLELEQARLKELAADRSYQELMVEQEKRRFELQVVRAPADGIIVGLYVTQGETVTTDLNATVICDLAPQLDEIEVRLEIDESDVCSTRPGQQVSITVDSSPGQNFSGTLERVSYAPKGRTGTSYEGIVTLANNEEVFRPGMTAHATIDVASTAETLSIPNQAFAIDQHSIQNLAKRLGYQTILSEQTEGRSVWTAKSGQFCEKKVECGLNDDTDTAIASGLCEDDRVIIDVETANELDELYAKIARS